MVVKIHQKIKSKWMSQLAQHVFASAALGILVSCSTGINPPQTPSTSDDGNDVERDQLSITCAHPDSYNNPSCRKVEFKCAIVKNENVNKPQYVQADEAPSCELGLGAKSTRDDDQFRWAVQLSPQGGEDYNRQFRFVVTNDEDIPEIIQIPRSSSNPRVEFEVDLRRTIINDKGNKENKYLCAEGSKWGQTVKRSVTNDPSCSISLVVREWVKQNKKGSIAIAIQDVTYCFTQNTKNRGVSGSQTDCSNPKSGGFRSQSFEINYHLDCDVNEWWKQVGGGLVGGTIEFVNRWINNVLSPTRVREVLTRSGCA